MLGVVESWTLKTDAKGSSTQFLPPPLRYLPPLRMTCPVLPGVVDYKRLHRQGDP